MKRITVPAIQNNHSFQIRDVIAAQKNGEPRGIYSICSSNAFVLQASLSLAVQEQSILLIESTSNQVNQYGGYTGFTPADFRNAVIQLAHKYKLKPGQLVLGGDHLGPNVWKKDPSEISMVRAKELIIDYVKAGYQKIHIDTSMPLGTETFETLTVEIAADRAAALCEVAESTYAEVSSIKNEMVYVIGTEVPPPGGITQHDEGLIITSAENAQKTLGVMEKAFRSKGLEDAWKRVIALVVQPGVDYGDNEVIPYRREKAAHLVKYIEQILV
jgi:D-tagatose-1,6-bisphosphate aldolase subunit GatZ/KbaZ